MGAMIIKEFRELGPPSRCRRPSDLLERRSLDDTAYLAVLAVENAGEAAAWYERALDATELWSPGSVVGLRSPLNPYPQVRG